MHRLFVPEPLKRQRNFDWRSFRAVADKRPMEQSCCSISAAFMLRKTINFLNQLLAKNQS